MLADLQVDRILDFIIQQLSDCTSKTTAHGSSNDSDATAQKQLCKHLLHTVALISEAQLYRCLSAIVTAHGTPENGINSNISRGLQLLNALRSHLQLPHSTKSLSISQLVYQCLERVLKCIIEQQQQQTPSSKQSPGSKQQNRCPANRTSKDICKAAAAALPQQFQQQLLLQLQPCYSAVWHARLLLAGDLQDIVSARFSLQIQAAAHRCLLLLQTLYIIAGTKQQMQQQLLGLVSGNNHEVKEEGQKADDSCKQRQQQQQQQIPLATVLKQLLDNYKAAQKLTGDPGSSSSSKQRSRITPPPSPAAAAAAATGLRPGVDAAAVMAMSSELCVSGIQAWGLMAGQLGPLFLDKSVGQPMLTVSNNTVVSHVNLIYVRWYCVPIALITVVAPAQPDHHCCCLADAAVGVHHPQPHPAPASIFSLVWVHLLLPAAETDLQEAGSPPATSKLRPAA